MGWARGEAADGRAIGYGVEAICDFPGCDEEIDRGLGYCCGSMHDSANDDGCGKYFCEKHRPMSVHGCAWQDDDDEDTIVFYSPRDLQKMPGVGAITIKSDPAEITSFQVGSELMIGMRLVAERFHQRLEGVDQSNRTLSGILLSTLLPTPKYAWEFARMRCLEFWAESDVDRAIQKAFDDLKLDVPHLANSRES